MLHYAGLCLRCLVSPLRTSYCIFYASGDTKKDTSSLQREVTSGQRTSACLRGSKRQTRDSPVYTRKNRDSRSETERRAALTCQRPPHRRHGLHGASCRYLPGRFPRPQRSEWKRWRSSYETHSSCELTRRDPETAASRKWKRTLTSRPTSKPIVGLSRRRCSEPPPAPHPSYE